MNNARFLAAAVQRPSSYRLNLSEKAFNGTVIPGQTMVGIVAAQYRAEPLATGRRSECVSASAFPAEFLQLGHQLGKGAPLISGADG
jgi:hypothetical protein